MSQPQAAEESVTYIQLLVDLVNGPEDIAWGPSTAAGTRVLVRRGEVWKAYLVSDLPAPSKAHNLLSTTHLDTTPQSPPLDPSGIIGNDGAGHWYEVDAAPNGLTQVLVAPNGGGNLAQWIYLPAAQPNLIFHEAFDQSQQSTTIPNADTVVKTLTLITTIGFSFVIAQADGFVQFGALSTNQSVLIKIKRNGVQLGATMQVDAALGAASKIPFSLQVLNQALAGNDVYTVTVSAAAADVNTTIFVNSLSLKSVS